MDKIIISIKFFAHFRNFLNKDKISLEVDHGTNILQLLTLICNLFNLQEKILDSNNKIKNEIRILVNGRQIRFLNGIKTKIHEGDQISIFPLLLGG